MQQRRVRQLRLWFLAGLTLAAVIAFWIFMGPWIGWRRVEHAIRQSETAPSQATTDNLARLLRRGYPTPEQGSRILASLFRPHVTTRRAYPAGRRPTIALRLPFQVGHLGESFAFRESLWADGESTDTSVYIGAHYLEGAHRIVALGHPLRAGQACEAEICCHIWFATPGRYHPLIRSPVVRGVVRDVVARFNRKSAVRIGNPKTKEYECDFVVPVSLVAAQDGAAGRIDLRSNPQLDASIRSALVSRLEAWMGGNSHVGGQARSWHGGATIAYNSLPLAVAFKATLRLPDGRELPQSSEPVEPLRARAGASGQFQISVVDFVESETSNQGVLRTPGEYTGAIVLKSDPNLGYDDPTIDAIWNGTLEFPIQFAVALEPNTTKPEQGRSER